MGFPQVQKMRFRGGAWQVPGLESQTFWNCSRWPFLASLEAWLKPNLPLGFEARFHDMSVVRHAGLAVSHLQPGSCACHLLSVRNIWKGFCTLYSVRGVLRAILFQLHRGSVTLAINRMLGFGRLCSSWLWVSSSLAGCHTHDLGGGSSCGRVHVSVSILEDAQLQSSLLFGCHVLV